MATVIELQTKIDTANSAQSLGQLRKSLKDLISAQAQVGAGSAEFNKLSKAINDTEGRIGDLNDSFATLRGSGVERLNASFGLLREGITNLDTEKVGIAFKGLGAAMKTIPIFLVAEGVKLLVENFSELVKFFGIGIKESDKLAASLEKQKKVNEGLFTVQENNIKLMQAEGASIDHVTKATKALNDQKIQDAKNDIELQKLKIREILLNDSITESLERTGAAVLRAQGNTRDADLIDAKIYNDKLKRASEFGDQIRTDLITINNLQTASKIAEIEVEKKHTQYLKKVNEDRQKEFDAVNKMLAAKQKEIEKQAQIESDAEDKALFDQAFAEGSQRQDLELEREKYYAEEKKKIRMAELQGEQFLANQRMAIANDLVNGLASIGIKNKAVANTIFLTQKALAIAGVIIDTQKETAAYSANPTWSALPDGGATLKSAAIIQARIRAGIRIGVIGATALSKFMNGGSGDVGAGGGISSSGGGTSIAPPQPQPQSQNFNNSTIGAVGGVGNGRNMNKIFISSYDMSRAQKNDEFIEAQATF